MMSLRPFTAGGLILLLLVGCSEGAGEDEEPAPPTEAQKVAELEKQGLIPSLDRSGSLAGPDADADGVRDDVARFVEGLGASDTQEEALLQLAETFQSSLQVDVEDPEAVNSIALRMSRAVNCVYDRFPDRPNVASELVEDVEAVSANTRARLIAYLRYNDALDGTVAALPEEGACETP